MSRLHLDGRRIIDWCSVRLAPPTPAPYRRHPESRHILGRAFREAMDCYTRARRFREADDLAERGLAALPEDRDLLIRHARGAQNEGRFGEAVARWRRALASVPDEPACHVGLAAVLRETGDHRQAQTAIGEALRQFPLDLAVVAEAARLASCRGQSRTALELWQRAAQAPEPHPDWLEGYIRALIDVGAFAEADAAIAAAVTAFPGNAGLATLQEVIASARSQGAELLRRSTEPEPLVVEGIASDRPAPAAADPADRVVDLGPPAPASEPDRSEEDEALKTLLLRFESLGDSCEFGLVQRRYAAEPLGLLRWSDVVFDELVEALDNRFVGMGTPANTRLTLAPDGEYCLSDRRWSLTMHTFLYDDGADRRALYDRMCRRITYLRDKLLSDLTEAEKTFVYASAGLDDARAERLHRALRAFGPIKLLLVQPAVVPSAAFSGTAGDVVEVDRDRHVAFLRRGGRGGDGRWDIAFEDWASICRKAAALA